ncbi:MAG TPA: alpha-2-macroglobulin family protein, partial [Myxococcota bacterium]|nr:alpha-2-macroglobulin family protein [Myxococcota bacterium]
RFAELIRRPDPSPAELALLGALLRTVPLARPSAELVLPSSVRELAERGRLKGLRSDLVARAVRKAELALATGSPPLESLLTGIPLWEGISDPQRPAHLDPWHRPHTWESARLLVPSFDSRSFGSDVTSLRLELLDPFMPRLRGKTLASPRELSTMLRVSRHLTLDAWGRPLMVVPDGSDLLIASAGPDGEHGTDDDLTRSRDEVLTSRLIGHGSGGLGFVGYGAGGGGSGSDIVRLRTSNAEVLSAVRERFDTNVLWEAVTTDASGHHRFEVPLSDSTTTWRVDVEAMTDDGRFGHARSSVSASLPVSVDLRLPDALIAGDRFVARALAVNTTTSPRELVLDATAEGLTLGELPPDDTRFLLAPGQARALALPIFATQPGRARVQLTLTDSGGIKVDSIVKHLEIQDIGQERRLTRRVRLDGRSPATLDTSIPSPSGPPRELTATLTAQRGVPDLALSSLGALLRTPTGCFEQTTAKSWPNLLVLRLLPKDHPLAAKARDLAIAGYERLKTFEVSPGQGFALYPGERPATILTAIGLVQLVDAAAVIDVERPLLDRVATALIDRQSSDGRFRIDSGWYGSEDQLAVTAYAAWSIAEALRSHTRAPDLELFSETTARSLTRSLTRAQRALKQRGGDTGLSAYTEVLAQLAGAPAGRGAATPIEPKTIYSAGPAARVELAALSLLNTIRQSSSQDGQRYLDELMAARTSGGWPTTQATIHALRALAELDTGTPTGELELALASGQALAPLPLDSTTLPTRSLATSQLAAPLTLRSTSPVLVELDLIWREANAPTRESQGLSVHVEAPARPLRLGEQTTLTIGVHNPSDTTVHLPTATLELPPGVELDIPALRSLTHGAGHLEHVEVFGRRVELYFDVLPKGAAALVPLTLTATHEAEVTMRPAEAFAYYDPQLRGQSDPLRLTVTP